MGVDMYDQTGMEIGWWSISYRYSGYTDDCTILSMSHYNKLYVIKTFIACKLSDSMTSIFERWKTGPFMK